MDKGRDAPRSGQDVALSGWAPGAESPIPLAPSFDWADSSALSRSFASQLQSLKFLDAVLLAYDRDREPADLDYLASVLLSWGEFAQSDPPDSSMCWYDLSTSLRVPRILGVAARALRDHSQHGEAIARMIPHLLNGHRERLSSLLCATISNKSLFVLAALAEIAVIDDAVGESSGEAAAVIDEILALFSQQFMPDGGHVEHSPAHQRMTLLGFHSVFKRFVPSGHPALGSPLRGAYEALSWMYRPDGNLVEIGDTTPERLPVPTAPPMSPNARFVFSRGGEGQRARRQWKALPDSGWAFVRSPSEDSASEPGGESYLAFHAGFHSRSHKHADDLSLCWSEGLVNILVDGGKFGYGAVLPRDSDLRRNGFYYADPRRQYIESTRAHSTVLLDGVDHDRVHRKPYGGGDVQAGLRSGRFTLSGTAPHGTWTHRRLIGFRPGRKLTVRDTVRLHDGQAHRMESRFLIDGRFSMRMVDGVVEMCREDAGVVLRIQGHDALERVPDVALGWPDPLEGWRSESDGEVTPCWSIVFRAECVKVTVGTVTFDVSTTKPEPSEGDAR
ncbi:heparinase II/III family protein [Brachybacterium sp. MASK1Z-5]|uniref:Heparinase II/III family protein n=1 Tax=Brachybacterium halotolerans TaxID=2795215 RepID=A0ABS1B7X1_9MICO|nr:heparinase II/III family protein [Brachybacterium halotolerans]MBK0330728.1 heparinase II/III family protein [Brachybacterium halotolerans]